jgi:preprotein translocase subunit SecE
MMSWWNRSKTFIGEARFEMRKVTYPSRDEVISTTIVVLVTSVIFAIYLYIADLVIGAGYGGILKVFQS